MGTLRKASFAWVPALILVAALAGGCAKEKKAGVAIAAPDFALKTVDGSTLRLSELRGKVVLLDFWATWCPPCRAAIPHIVELQQALGSQGFTAVGMNLDENGDDLVAFLQRNPVAYPVVRTDEPTRTAYGGVTAIPQVFLVDRKGNIREHFQGYTREIGEKMRQSAEALLKEPA